MNPIAISVKGLSKKYRLFNSPNERFKEALHPFKKKYHKEFWALKDINIDVKKGSTVGIIGRNGSGKSTFLQIICGVLKPTSGSMAVDGRISALLELGAGFNPELTGRKNVILNGIVQGFSRNEMDARISQIQDFADIGEFFDQPVKIYSSGMFVRLAFATAINVDPDILVIDEALAVGDAKFQHKCYNKFLELQEAGKTIVFVTHDMNAITRHCHHAILLEKGTIIESGMPNDVVNRYFKVILTDDSFDDTKTVSDKSAFVETATTHAENHQKAGLDRFLEEMPEIDNCMHRKSYNKNEYRFGDKRAEIVDYLIICKREYDPIKIQSGNIIDIYLKVRYFQNVNFPAIGFTIKTVDGVVVYANNTKFDRFYIQPFKEPNIAVFKTSIKLDLVEGDYFISQGVAEIIDEEHIPIDRRCDLIHLYVSQNMRFDGLVRQETKFEEVFRRKV